MSDEYQHPDDPEVFARVLEQFRNTPVAYWQAQIEHHARAARALAKAAKANGIAEVASKKRKVRAPHVTNGSVTTAMQTNCTHDSTDAGK